MLPEPKKLYLVRPAVAVLCVVAVACGRPSGVATIPPEELARRIETASPPAILDVRTPSEFARGHIPGAVNIPHTQIRARADELGPHRQEIVVYCARGPRAYHAERILLEKGFKNVRHLRGDMTGWRRRGLPVER